MNLRHILIIIYVLNLFLFPLLFVLNILDLLIALSPFGQYELAACRCCFILLLGQLQDILFIFINNVGFLIELEIPLLFRETFPPYRPKAFIKAFCFCNCFFCSNYTNSFRKAHGR